MSPFRRKLRDFVIVVAAVLLLLVLPTCSSDTPMDYEPTDTAHPI